MVGAPQPGTAGCSIDGQKQFVLDQMRTVYYWYRDLPPNVDLSQYPTPEALLDYLTSFQPLDGFSYIDLAEADAQFFGEGQYEGYGFSSRFDARQSQFAGRVETRTEPVTFILPLAEELRVGFGEIDVAETIERLE